MSTVEQDAVKQKTVKQNAKTEDRTAIEELLYSYASSIDSGQMHKLHDILHPDLWAQYGNGEPVQGASAVIDWMTEFTKTCEWQHHMLSVYSIDIQGDAAKSLVYHNSYEKFAGDDEVCFLIARYHNELVRHEGRWKISKLVFEIVWGEKRPANTDYIAAVGGRGPAVPGWP
ncbi:nuclear transport factor 2 family protein [Rhodococcoides yunnanense]|uniref:nuclear transport factor 2 family protein n=1 Tax=Rhodococcoides yunnanense TaxID=278209 RepID=UPI000933839D|nr:nuclear transport factor 2 family protein [Rhodococcus yunnanensis]